MGMLIVWLLIRFTLFMLKLTEEMSHQATMLKHRPRLWWQFHKKYRSCADPMLELDSAAMLDMTEEEFNQYYRKLHNLREQVCRSRCNDSGVRVTKGFARYKQMIVPPEPRYDDVYEEGIDWLDKQ
jgi:hypothetical protein